MAPITDGKYRTFIVIEFPVSLAYQKKSMGSNLFVDKLIKRTIFQEQAAHFLLFAQESKGLHPHH